MTLSVGANGTNTTYSGLISGGVNSGLTVAGGSLLLTAANTFSGSTTLVGGTLQLGNLNALQNSTLTVNSAGGLLTFASGAARTTSPGSPAARPAHSSIDPSSVSLSVGGNGDQQHLRRGPDRFRQPREGGGGQADPFRQQYCLQRQHQR